MKRDLDETNCSASSSSSPKRLKSDPTEVPASSEEKASNGVVETASPLDAFPVESLTRFQKRCASYQQPTEVGYFSYDEHRKLHLFSDKELKYYYQPEPNANLNEGYPQLFTKRDDSIPEHLDSLLECLTAVNQRAEQGGKPSIQPKFCTWRGIMTKIMCTPYLQNDAWELGATRYKGTIYIEEHETDERKQRKYGETDRDKLMTYWGYKFESLSTVSKPPSSITGPDDPELLERRRQPVNTNIQYCSVFNTKLGQNSILMGAEVDCLTGDSKNSPKRQQSYIELKTNRIITNDRQKRTFERFKLLKIWAQSFLPGIPKVVVGFRDDSGYVKTVETFNTLEIPRMVRNSNAKRAADSYSNRGSRRPNDKGSAGDSAWDATVCINFADMLLDWIRAVVSEDDPKLVYTIRFVPAKKEVQILGPTIEYAFLPPWFYETKSEGQDQKAPENDQKMIVSRHLAFINDHSSVKLIP